MYSDCDSLEPSVLFVNHLEPASSLSSITPSNAASDGPLIFSRLTSWVFSLSIRESDAETGLSLLYELAGLHDYPMPSRASLDTKMSCSICGRRVALGNLARHEKSRDCTTVESASPSMYRSWTPVFVRRETTHSSDAKAKMCTLFLPGGGLGHFASRDLVDEFIGAAHKNRASGLLTLPIPEFTSESVRYKNTGFTDATVREAVGRLSSLKRWASKAFEKDIQGSPGRLLLLMMTEFAWNSFYNWCVNYGSLAEESNPLMDEEERKGFYNQIAPAPKTMVAWAKALVSVCQFLYSILPERAGDLIAVGQPISDQKILSEDQEVVAKILEELRSPAVVEVFGTITRMRLVQMVHPILVSRARLLSDVSHSQSQRSTREFIEAERGGFLELSEVVRVHEEMEKKAAELEKRLFRRNAHPPTSEELSFIRGYYAITLLLVRPMRMQSCNFSILDDSSNPTAVALADGDDLSPKILWDSNKNSYYFIVSAYKTVDSRSRIGGVRYGVQRGYFSSETSDLIRSYYSKIRPMFPCHEESSQLFLKTTKPKSAAWRGSKDDGKFLTEEALGLSIRNVFGDMCAQVYPEKANSSTGSTMFRRAFSTFAADIELDDKTRQELCQMLMHSRRTSDTYYVKQSGQALYNKGADVVESLKIAAKEMPATFKSLHEDIATGGEGKRRKARQTAQKAARRFQEAHQKRKSGSPKPKASSMAAEALMKKRKGGEKKRRRYFDDDDDDDNDGDDDEY